MCLIKWVYKMNWPPQIIFLQHKYFFPIFYLNKYTIQWQWLWVHLFRVCNTNIVLTNIKMEYWRDNEDEHYLEGLSYHQPEKKERWKRKKVNSWAKPLACNFLFQPYSLFVLSILVVIKIQYQYLMGQTHDKNKEKYRAREILSFRALVVIYCRGRDEAFLFIYLCISIPDTGILF